MGIFYKLRNKLPDEILKQLYFAFVHSHITYAAEIYIQWFIQTPPGGVITSSFHATPPPPNHLKFKGGYQGVFTVGVYVIVMEG